MVTKDKQMTIHVFDTWVENKKGETMHFDVFTLDKSSKKAIECAKEYLKSVGEEDAKVTAKECSFCHSQTAPDAAVKDLKKQGYFIYKMMNCP